MYKSHEKIKTPKKNLVIWRYMDLWKFLDIIDNDRIWLSQAGIFEDKLEGRVPFKSFESVGESHPLKSTDDFSERVLKKTHYISSWSEEKQETYPLWKIYSNYRTAVAIKSTVGNLIDSIHENSGTQYIGRIKYIKPKSKYIFAGNTYQLFFEKRDYFSFEKEIRLVTELPHTDNNDLLNLPLGTHLKINPKVLINEIILAPLAGDSFKNLIESKLKEKKLNIKVNFSEI